MPKPFDSKALLTAIEKDEIKEVDLSDQVLTDPKVILDPSAKSKIETTLENKEIESQIWSLTISEGNLICGLENGTLEQWDLKTGRCVKSIKTKGDGISALTTLPDGLVALGRWDFHGSARPIELWNLKAGTPIKNLEKITCSTWALTWLSNSFAFAGGISSDGSGDDSIGNSNVYLLEPKKGECTATLKGPQNINANITALAFNREKNQLACGDSKGIIRIWDLKNKTCIATLETTPVPFEDVQASDMKEFVRIDALTYLTQSCLISAHMDGTIRIWNLENKSYRIVLNLFNYYKQIFEPKYGKEWMDKIGLGFLYFVRALAVLPSGKIAIASLGKILIVNPCLRPLRLTDIMEHFRALQKNTSVKKVNLQKMQLTDNDVKLLASVLLKTKVEQIDLRNTAISASAARGLIEALKERKPPLEILHSGLVRAASEDEIDFSDQLFTDPKIILDPSAKSKVEATLENKEIKSEIWSLTINEGSLICGRENRTLEQWDLETGRCVKSIKTDGEGISALTTLPDGLVALGRFSLWRLRRHN